MVSFHRLGRHPLDEAGPPWPAAPAAADPAGLGTELWGAAERGELRLVYQPVVDLRTGAPVGVEALVRWRHPRLGPLMPESFIPAGEASGAIAPMGAWVLEEACAQLRRWRGRRPALGALAMAVNLSPAELSQPDLTTRVAGALRAADLEPGRLTLEITETAAPADGEAATRAARALRGLGVRLALDDFGTGFSSLTHLRRLPVDALKIDRAFVAELETSPGTAAIVRAVAALAHALGLTVVGEGFETGRQLARLRDAACDHGQGFYVSPPLPPDDLLPLLQDALP